MQRIIEEYVFVNVFQIRGKVFFFLPFLCVSVNRDRERERERESTKGKEPENRRRKHEQRNTQRKRDKERRVPWLLRRVVEIVNLMKAQTRQQRYGGGVESF